MQFLSTAISRIAFVLLLMNLCYSNTNAQKKGSSPDNCRLDDAKKWYEEGELERVAEIETCASDPKSMSREKRIEALQLITESYLYRNKVGRADKTFRKLLKVDPLHEIDSTKADNSWDLIYLSRTFSRRPIFKMYVGAGINFSLIQTLQNYGVDNTSGVANNESYLDKVVIGGNGCLGFELPLIYNFDLAIEANFAYRNFAFGDSLIVSANPTNPTGEVGTSLGDRAGDPLLYSRLSFTENQYWIDLPVILKYNITFKKMLPYIYVGGGPNFLLAADIKNITRTTEDEGAQIGGGQVIQPPTDPIILTKSYNSDRERSFPTMRTMINWSFIAGAGVKFRLGRNFLFIDFRYTRMFLNNVKTENRYSNPELLYRYAHVDNDFRTDNFALTFGFVKAFYVPRKKRKFNPITIDNKFDKWLEKERKNIKKETDEELKSELNSSIKQMEREKPSLIEDVERGRVGEEALDKKKAEFEKLKNK